MVKGADNAARVLVLLTDGAEAELACHVLALEGFNCWVAPDSGQFCAQLGLDPMAVLTSEEALAGIMGPFQSALARQPPWSDLPLIIFTGADDQTEAHQRLQRALGPLCERALDGTSAEEGHAAGSRRRSPGGPACGNSRPATRQRDSRSWLTPRG